MADDNAIPLSWILVFLLLALGLAVAAVRYSGGSILPALLPA